MKHFITICVTLTIIVFINSCTLDLVDLSGQILVFPYENDSEYIIIDSKSSSNYINFDKRNNFYYNFTSWEYTKLKDFLKWSMQNTKLSKKIRIGQGMYEVTADISWDGRPEIYVKDSNNGQQHLSSMGSESISLDREIGRSPELNWNSITSQDDGSATVRFNEPTSKHDFIIQAKYYIEVSAEKVFKNSSLDYIKTSGRVSATLKIKNTICLSGSNKYISKNKSVDVVTKVLDYDLDGAFTENDKIKFDSLLTFSTGELPFNRLTKLYKLSKQSYIFNLQPYTITTPTELTDLTDILAVATGKNHSLVLKADGTVLSWGDDSRGQRGLGFWDTTPYYQPKSIQKFADIVAIAAGNKFSGAVKRDGTVCMWGDNEWGQLGIAPKDNYSTKPIQVPGLNGVKTIALGEDFSLALKEDGTVWSWGHNDCGQLGDGTYINRNVPKYIPNLSEIKQIIAINKYALALKTDGSIWLWGRCPSSEKTYLTEPRKITTIKDITVLAAGEYHAIALKEDGTVWRLDFTHSGSEEDKTDFVFSPEPIHGLIDVIDIGASRTYSMAVKKDGTVWAWGFDREGIIGMPDTDMTPVQISALNDIKMIECGPYHVLAVTNSGKVWGWGKGLYGSPETKVYLVTIKAVEQ